MRYSGYRYGSILSIIFAASSFVYHSSGLVLSSNSNPKRVTKPRKTQSLVEHLQLGKSKISKDISVVSITEHECGLRYHRNDDTSSPSRLPSLSSVQKEKESFVFVHRNEFITPLVGSRTDAGQAVNAYFQLHRNEPRIQKHTDELPSIQMAIFLSLTQQKKIDGGLYLPYLNSLPTLKDLQHLPVFWSEKSMIELQQSTLRDAISQRKIDWEQEYNIVKEALQDAEANASSGSPRSTNRGRNEKNTFVDLATWYWARCIITSRGFADAKTGEVCLVPFIDYMNHISSNQASKEPNVVRCNWNINAEGFHLRLPEDDNKIMGDESDNIKGKNLEMKRIEISYGSLGNSLLLMNYGFSVLEDTQQILLERVTVPLNLPRSLGRVRNDAIRDDDHDTAIRDLWEADGLGDCHDCYRNVTLSIGNLGSIKSLLSLCRVAVIRDKNELHQMQDLFVQRGETTSQTQDGLVPQLGATLCRVPFSIPNEIRAMEKFQVKISDMISSYETTLAQDNRLLFSHESSKEDNNVDKIKESSIIPNDGGGEVANNHNALILRRGEKRVLQYFHDLATSALEFLKEPDSNFENYIELLESSCGDTPEYLFTR